MKWDCQARPVPHNGGDERVEMAMAQRSVATVFGGSGFIGRYVVKRLAAQGHIVRVAGRHVESARSLMTVGRVGQMVPYFVALGRDGDVRRAVDGAELVVNLVGLLAEPKAGDFDRVQAKGAGLIARMAAAAGVSRMVAVSAIGADPGSPSAYARSKAAGEAAVREAMPGAVILRPSVVFGAEDKFFNRFGAMAMMLPVMPVIHGATRFQPVYVGDVADAVLAGLDREDTAGQTYELGGPEVLTFREVLAYILKHTLRHRPLVNIPDGLARLQARLGEMVPGKPFTRDQLLLLSRDNVASPGVPGLAELGITATPIDMIVPDYLARYRPGGGRKEPIPA